MQAQGLYLLGSRATGSGVAARRLSCSTACGIFPDQAWSLCLLHWQVDSLPLSTSVSHSVTSDFSTPWTVDHQAPLSMGFSTQEYWSELSFPS